jgi:hypothetical protein
VKLEIVGSGRNSAVAWVDPEDGEAGAHVGQDAARSPKVLEGLLTKAKETFNRDEIEYLVVEISALRWYWAEGQDKGATLGFTGISGPEKVMKELLRVSKEALKNAGDETPMPEWATKALEAGWKPPKGWKP